MWLKDLNYTQANCGKCFKTGAALHISSTTLYLCRTGSDIPQQGAWKLSMFLERKPWWVHQYQPIKAVSRSALSTSHFHQTYKIKGHMRNSCLQWQSIKPRAKLIGYSFAVFISNIILSNSKCFDFMVECEKDYVGQSESVWNVWESMREYEKWERVRKCERVWIVRECKKVWESIISNYSHLMGVEGGASIPDSNHSRRASHSLHSTSGQSVASVVHQAMIFHAKNGRW